MKGCGFIINKKAGEQMMLQIINLIIIIGDNNIIKRSQSEKSLFPYLIKSDIILISRIAIILFIFAMLLTIITCQIICFI